MTHNLWAFGCELGKWKVGYRNGGTEVVSPRWLTHRMLTHWLLTHWMWTSLNIERLITWTSNEDALCCNSLLRALQWRVSILRVCVMVCDCTLVQPAGCIHVYSAVQSASYIAFWFVFVLICICCNSLRRCWGLLKRGASKFRWSTFGSLMICLRSSSWLLWPPNTPRRRPEPFERVPPAVWPIGCLFCLIYDSLVIRLIHF